jgi:hypothetical protein
MLLRKTLAFISRFFVTTRGLLLLAALLLTLLGVFTIVSKQKLTRSLAGDPASGGGVGDPGGGNVLETRIASALKLAIAEMLPLRNLLEKNYWPEMPDQEQLEVSLNNFLFKIGGGKQSSVNQLEYLAEFLNKLDKTEASCQPIVATTNDIYFCKKAFEMYNLSPEKCQKDYLEQNRLAIGKPYLGLLIRENIWNQTHPSSVESQDSFNDNDLPFILHEVAQNCMGLNDSAQEGHPISSAWFILYMELRKIRGKLANYHKHFPKILAHGILDRKNSQKLGGSEYYGSEPGGLIRTAKSYCESFDGPLYLEIPKKDLLETYEKKIKTSPGTCVATLEVLKEYDELVILEYPDLTSFRSETKNYRIKGKRNKDVLWTSLYEYK